jgi:hypothetical protein
MYRDDAHFKYAYVACENLVASNKSQLVGQYVTLRIGVGTREDPGFNA